MKVTVLAIACMGGVALASHEQTQSWGATLPNGVGVELVGVSFHRLGKRPQPAPWWRPDGSRLPEEPLRRPDKSTTANYDEYSCEFALRVESADEYSCVAFQSLGQSVVAPGVPYDANDQPLPELRSFVGNFKKNRLTDAIRIGISTATWQQVDRWEHQWPKFEPEDITVNSDEALVFTWPRKHRRGAVIVEITHRYVDEATRLLMYDKEGNIHEDTGGRHGRGEGIEKRTYWYWGTPLEDIRAFEFQRRPYQWVEFRNVSLQPDKRTNVEVVVLGERAALSPTTTQRQADREALGSMLDRLVANLAFPTTGRARYRIEEKTAFRPDLRLLDCVYAFSGARYAFEVTEMGSETFDLKYYFDGTKSVRWIIPNDIATVWEDRRQQRPIYRLDRFWPAGIMDDLLGHAVELAGTGSLDGVPCSLITSTLSSKDRLKVWVASEPDAFPLRIERYEHDHLCYVYQARTLRTRNDVPYPERIEEASYRWDEAVGLVPRGRFAVRIESFEPHAHVPPETFTPPFSPQTTVSTRPSGESDASAFEATTPARRIQDLREIAVAFDLEQAKGKRLLLCFFDVNQRPARRCVLQLARLAEQLREKGICLAVVQAAQVDRTELDAWAAEQQIPFPVGSIEGDIETVKSTWGVHSLPWLILTDENHTVQMEGISLGDLTGLLGTESQGNR